MTHPLSPSVVDFSRHAQPDTLRRRIAGYAARLIAQDGSTYAIARKKALQQVFGSRRVDQSCVPDNSLIEQEVLRYRQLFFAQSQSARLLHLRQLALQVMLELAPFHPTLTGAVLNGSAGEYDDIVLELFVDNSKEVAISLLNRGIAFDVSEAVPIGGRLPDPIETLSFVRDKEGIHLVLLRPDDLRRSTVRKTARANAGALQQLIQES